MANAPTDDQDADILEDRLHALEETVRLFSQKVQSLQQEHARLMREVSKAKEETKIRKLRASLSQHP